MPQLISEEKKCCECTGKRLLPWPGETCPKSLATLLGLGGEQALPDRNSLERSRDCSQWVTQAALTSHVGAHHLQRGQAGLIASDFLETFLHFYFWRHTTPSVTSLLMTSKGISISSCNQHLLTYSWPTQLYSLPSMPTHNRGSDSRMPRSLCKGNREQCHTTGPQWRPRRPELPDTTILPNRQDFGGPRKGACDHWLPS